MRYEYLKAYLDMTVSPLQSDQIIQACELLHEMGIDGHDLEIEQELALGEEADTSIVLSSIQNLIMPLLEISIKNFGVDLLEDVTLAQRVDILNGLNLIDNYGDPVTVLQMCDNVEGPEVALSNILPLMGLYQPGEYITLLDSVNPSLLERIESVLRDDSYVQVPEAAEVTRARDRLKAYASTQVNPLWVVQDIRAGSRLGLAPGLLMVDKIEALESLDTTQLAAQVLGYILASSADHASLREACAVELEAVLHDPLKVTQADSVTAKLIQGLSDE